MQAPKQTDKSINVLQSASYALPVIPVTMLITPLVIIQGIYAKHFGLALTTLAGILLLSRVLDAVSDPLIGYFSDRYRAKHGTRKPFIIAGTLLVLLCGYFLYLPPSNMTALYAGFWMIAMYTAFTFFEIPHITWPSDMAGDSVSKAKLYSYRVFTGYCGLVFFYGIPLLPFFESTAITLETLKVTFIAAAIFALPFLVQAIWYVPSGTTPAPSPSRVRVFSWGILRSSLKEIVADKPLALFLSAFVFSGFSVGMWYGLIYIYVDSYLDMGDQYAKMGLLGFIVGLSATPLWYGLAVKVGKKTCWSLATTLLVASYLYTITLEPLHTTFSQLVALKIVQTCGYCCLLITTPAILSDITDYSQWRTGSEKRATYFSIKVFVEKINVATGAAASLAIAGWWGFEVGSGAEQSEGALNGLNAAIGWLPAALAMISMIFILLSPINERRHRIIRLRLDARLARAETRPLSAKDKPFARYSTQEHTT